jgi:hypothetical protein
MTAKADQALTSQECYFLIFAGFGLKVESMLATIRVMMLTAVRDLGVAQAGTSRAHEVQDGRPLLMY